MGEWASKSEVLNEQEQVENAKTVAQQKNKATACGWGCGIVLVLLFVGLFVLNNIFCSPSKKTTDSSQPVELTARVHNSGSQIEITNNDTFTWSNVTVSLNYETWGNGFTNSVSSLAPGDTVKFGLMTFTKESGERFNPITYAVKKLEIKATTEKGMGFWFGEP